MPFINPARTTITAYVDAHRDYRNPNQPEVTCTPETLRALCKWLRVFEWDLLQMLMAIDAREPFEVSACRTLDKAWRPVVPKSNYPPKT